MLDKLSRRKLRGVNNFANMIKYKLAQIFPSVTGIICSENFMSKLLETLPQTHQKFSKGDEIQPLKVIEYNGRSYMRLNQAQNISTANGSKGRLSNKVTQ